MYSYRDKKVVIVVGDALEPWIVLNVVGHLSLAIGAALSKELMGRFEHVDASGYQHRGICKYPIVVLKAKHAKISEIITIARSSPGLIMSDYPKQMLDTRHDDELTEAIASTKGDEFQYFGVLLYGSPEELKALTGKLSLWK